MRSTHGINGLGQPEPAKRSRCYVLPLPLHRRSRSPGPSRRVTHSRRGRCFVPVPTASWRLSLAGIPTVTPVTIVKSYAVLLGALPPAARTRRRRAIPRGRPDRCPPPGAAVRAPALQPQRRHLTLNRPAAERPGRPRPPLPAQPSQLPRAYAARMIVDISGCHGNRNGPR